MLRRRIIAVLCLIVLMGGCAAVRPLEEGELDQAYQEAQKALEMAEEWGAKELSGDLYNRASNLLEETREAQQTSPSRQQISDYRQVEALAYQAGARALNQKLQQAREVGKVSDVQGQTIQQLKEENKRLQQQVQSLKEERNRAQTQMGVLEQTIQQQKEEIARLEKLREEKGRVETQRSVLEQTIQQLKEENKRLQQQVQTLKEERNRAQTQMGVLEQTIQQQKEEIARLQKLKEQNNQLSTQLNVMEQSIQQLKQENKNLNSKMAQLKEEKGQLDTQLGVMEQSVQQLKQQNKELQNRNQKLNEQLQALREAEGKAGEMAQTLEKKDQQIAELEQETKDLREEIWRLEKDKKSISSKVDALIAKIDEKNRRIKKLQQQNQQIRAELEETVEKGKVRQEGMEVILNLQEKVLFDLGSPYLRPEAETTLQQVASVLKNHKNRMIRIEGHTDTWPINTRMFPSNWELSTRRATNVLRHLVEKQGVDKDRILAMGYGEFHPLVPNNTAANRQKNRRVEIVLYPKKLPFQTKTVQAQN